LRRPVVRSEHDADGVPVTLSATGDARLRSTTRAPTARPRRGCRLRRGQRHLVARLAAPGSRSSWESTQLDKPHLRHVDDGRATIYVADGTIARHEVDARGQLVWSGHSGLARTIQKGRTGSRWTGAARLRRRAGQPPDPEARSNGDFLLKWGRNGGRWLRRGAGWAIQPAPRPHAGCERHVYVADLNNDRIQKFDSSGNFLLKWGSTGPGTNQLNGPSDVAVTPSGEVWVTEDVNHRVHSSRGSGVHLAMFARTELRRAVQGSARHRGQRLR